MLYTRCDRRLKTQTGPKYSWWIGLLLLVAVSAPALEVKEMMWGFDGHAVPNRFNLVSLLVFNASDVPFEGSLSFQKTGGMAERVGAAYRTPCYISPMTARWVQFFVFTDNQNYKWVLQWGPAPEDSTDFKAPDWGPPARVLLSDSELNVNAASDFRRFPDELFPPTVAATSGLDSVLLDHEPRWEPAKRQAFLSWLKAGGKVHLLTGADGQYPTFSDELSLLNSPLDQNRIGAGLVIRHAATAQTINKQVTQAGDIRIRQIKPEEPNPMLQTTDSFFRVLTGLSRRHYNWELIYLLAFAYVAVVGPGNFLAGRRVADYRLRIVLLLATVSAFAFFFNLVGRRDRAEASVIHTLSYARAIDGNTYNVTQWLNLFATRGATYKIQHSSPHNLYATGQDYEAVNGSIMNGKDGQFVVDIPMYSRRALMHQAEMKGPEIRVKIETWDGAEKLTQLTLTVGADFAKEIAEAWVVQGDDIYGMKLADSGFQFGDQSQKMKSAVGRLEFGSDKQSLSTLLSETANQPYNDVQYSRSARNDDDAPDEVGEFRKLAIPLMGWALATEDLSALPVSSTQGHARLFIFARSPESFRVTGSQFARESGFVLYQIDLFRPTP